MSLYVNAECTECGIMGMCIVSGDECYCNACCNEVDATDADMEAAPLPDDDFDDDYEDDEFDDFDDDFPMELEYDDWRHDFNVAETDY